MPVNDGLLKSYVSSPADTGLIKNMLTTKLINIIKIFTQSFLNYSITSVFTLYRNLNSTCLT